MILTVSSIKYNREEMTSGRELHWIDFLVFPPKLSFFTANYYKHQITERLCSNIRSKHISKSNYLWIIYALGSLCHNFILFCGEYEIAAI